ncbi:hypothetical protein [Actinomadura violacea]|uniref:Uncharacterized protein n=1 Tax=Actinomadura violacea TaxID=2819934 RepID=A0ABS3RZK5_9ACTN|nr:hypothetical protein [Actinomadura violacea]MBO2461738.1 hypothetical protein [Actinomadura violacea]
MNVTYCLHTSSVITVGFVEVITCPECAADRGLCLTTSGGGQPVTGSCPAGHVWDEQRVTGFEVERTAIEGAVEKALDDVSRPER